MCIGTKTERTAVLALVTTWFPNEADTKCKSAFEQDVTVGLFFATVKLLGELMFLTAGVDVGASATQ